VNPRKAKPLLAKLDRTRHRVLLFIVGFGVSYGSAFSVDALLRGDIKTPAYVLPLVLTFASIGAYALLRPGRLSQRVLIVLSMMVLAFFLFVSGGTSGVGYLWSLILPMGIFFMLGLRMGLTLSLVHFAACALWAVAGAVAHVDLSLPPLNALLRSGALYLVLVSLSTVYEWIQKSAARELRREVDARSETERQLQGANVAFQAAIGRAKAANQAKSAFLANMSHEIRTPLNAILGFSQLLQRDPDATPRQRQKLDTINRSGEHLLALINDILEMSKIEAGRTVVAPSSFDLHAMLDDVAMMFRERIDAKHLAFELVREDSLPRFVHSDENKIRQILLNLVGNAVKFTDAGHVSLRARAAPADAGRFAVFIDVEDTGMGISEEDQARLFKSFEQTASGLKKASGTGLGLAISREFARMLGGDVTVTSAPGKGSLFRCRLLVDETEVCELVRDVSSRRVVGLLPGQPAYRVLVVDDKVENRTILREFLSPLGFEVREAHDGAQALDAFDEWQPHLILIDNRMPVMNGDEAIRAIRARPRGDAVKIITVTASTFSDYGEQPAIEGADELIGKPFREADLFGAIERAIGVKYLYEEPDDEAPPPPIPAADVPGDAPLPSADDLRHLLEMAQMGDMDALCERAAALKADRPELAPFADQVAQLASAFEEAAVRDVIQSAAERLSAPNAPG
jgi:signal transduction histidine kinase/CheY-like chemotaxis protein